MLSIYLPKHKSGRRSIPSRKYNMYKDPEVGKNLACLRSLKVAVGLEERE